MFHDISHLPRQPDKKRHKKGFSEGASEDRAARIGFKRYLRQLEEEEQLEEEDVEYDDDIDQE